MYGDRWQLDGWMAAVVTTGNPQRRHVPDLMTFAFEAIDGDVQYGQPIGGPVSHTRLSEAIGVPGASRESLHFTCGMCPEHREVSTRRWGEIVDQHRRVSSRFIDVSAYG